MKHLPAILSILIAVVLPAPSLASTPSGQNFLAAAGIVNQTPIGQTPLYGSGSMALDCSFAESQPGPTINVYVVYYSGTSTPWNGTTKNIVRAWIQAMNGSAWFTTLSQYPNSCSPPFTAPTNIVLNGECDDPHTEGLTFTCAEWTGGGGFDSIASIFTDNIVGGGGGGCSLPLDETNGLYIAILSDNTVTLAGGGGCHSTSTYLSAFGVNSAISFPQQWTAGQVAVNVNLTGFPLIDGMLGAMTHEMSEGIVDTEANFGWSAPPGTIDQNTELADVCEATAGFLDGYTYTTAGGQPASFGTTYLATRYDFMAVTDWQLSGTCASQLIPPVSSTCRTNSDCPAPPSNYAYGGCRNFQCQMPTCFDSLTDGDESDKDCGGSCPAMTTPSSAGYCLSGKHCRSGADCFSGVCTSSTCN